MTPLFKTYKRWRSSRNLIALGAFLGLLILAALYRFYQPVTHPALLEFDVFDWAKRSADILREHRLVTPTALWVFPVWNALVAYVLRVDIFHVYLFSGAIATTFNVILFFLIGRQLWKNIWPQLILPIFYIFDPRLLSRSVNYLPETLTYTFGLALLYFYIRLLRRNDWKFSLPAIAVLTYLYYHLHQSGLNFLIFTGIVSVLYIAFVLPVKWVVKLTIFAGLTGLALMVILPNAAIRQQFAFFSLGNANTDTAFQGIPIPYSQIFSDYSYQYVVLLLIGFGGVIVNLFRRQPIGSRLAWLVVVGVAGFYYAFLYLLPNLGLYSLIPWRFYTWFSLYAGIVATHGFALASGRFEARSWQKAVMFFIIFFPMVHGNLIANDMYTADATTIETMRKLPLPAGSTVVTTNANNLQARLAFAGRTITVNQAGPALFKADTAAVAYQAARQNAQDDSSFILISLYQVRQRPGSIDYWRTSAIYDMDISLFQNQAYFLPVYIDAQVALYQVRPAGL